MSRLTLFLIIIGSLSVSTLSKEDLFKMKRVTNGERVTKMNEYSYNVSLQRYGEHFCGGSILNNLWILTAAHCLEKTRPDQANGIKVFMGSSDWRTGGDLREVQEFHMHPQYDLQTMAYDIAVMKLSSPIEFSDNIQQIQMATKQPTDGTPCIVSGWGFTNSRASKLEYHLRSASVLFRPKEICGSPKYGYSSSLKDTMVCGEGSNNTDACQGDSGGPLVNKETGEQVGVVSWGYDCGMQGYPGIYSNVAELRPWVLSQLRAW